MGKSATNVAIVLGLLTVAFAGYYVFVQVPNDSVATAQNQQVMQEMITKTNVFIGHSQKLDRLLLNISIFEDDRFQSLENFTQEIEPQPIGKPDPFAEVNNSSS